MGAGKTTVGRLARAAPEAALLRFGPRNRGALRRADPGDLRDRRRGRLPRARGAGDRRADRAGRHRARHRRRRGAGRRRTARCSRRAARWSTCARTPEHLYERVRQDRNRPLLAGADPLGRLRELYARARPALPRDRRRGASTPARQSVQVLARGPARAAGGRDGNAQRSARQPRLPDPHRRRHRSTTPSSTAPYLGGGAAAIVTNAVVAPLYLERVRQGASTARASPRS